eukprot:684737-Hanusia_phi.AAC.3
MPREETFRNRKSREEDNVLEDMQEQCVIDNKVSNRLIHVITCTAHVPDWSREAGHNLVQEVAGSIKESEVREARRRGYLRPCKQETFL